MVYLEYPDYRSLRDATLVDVERVCQMVEAFYKASPYCNRISYDSTKISRTIRSLITCDDAIGKVILGLDKDGVPRGMLVCLSAEPFFSSEKVATELMWWIDPDHRASRMATELLGAYESWCDLYGYPIRQMVLLEALNGSELDKLYQKKNYELIEKAYIKGF